MSARLMEPGIAAALGAGRVVIVPSPQRAAALRWNWARLQLAQGLDVWHTPEVVTWDAWLESQWEKARLEGRVPASARRLNRSQQLQLWRRVLASLEDGFGAGHELTPHAAALMASASRAAQWLLPLSRLAVTDEERLLAAALAAAREWCRQHDCVALPLCTPAQLAAFVAGPAPLFAGLQRLSALQLALADQCWPGEQVLHAGEAPIEARPICRSAVNLEEELRACARWCEGHLAADPARRLLVISLTSAPSIDSQSIMLARELSAGTGEVPEDVLRSGLLAVEGGGALDGQQLIADALCALRLIREPRAYEDLARVLESPYLGWDEPSRMQALSRKLADVGFAQWPGAVLQAVLERAANEMPAAAVVASWLAGPRDWPRQASRLEWARLFSQWLGSARFARGAGLDSRDAQRLQRWSELLDEFAALDAVGSALGAEAALEELLQLAGQARHAARSGDAAITLTAERGAPLARYDGIWVLGLAEQRWPEPPRPDPYVPLTEQRRCGWDEAGARQRLEQAQWSLRQWRASADELVLSYPSMEGDVHHRPSALPGLEAAPDWHPVDVPGGVAEPFSTVPAVAAEGLAPLQQAAGRPLKKGRDRLRLQQECAFRSQAQVRLAAEPPPFVGDGIHPAVRGMLLHGVFEGIWRELGDQRALASLDEPARASLFGRHWSRQIEQLAADGWPGYPARLIARERARSLKLVLRMLALEEERPYFRVLWSERQLQLPTPAGVMTLRLDRLDEDGQGRRWLIDYKSGAADRFRMAQGEAQPLQLALYEQALALQQEPVHGMALLSLAPGRTGFWGAAPEPDWPGTWQRVPDWDAQRESWRAELARLLLDHVEGISHVAPLKGVCRHCHLSALCRRADPAAQADEAGDEEQGDD